MGIKSQLASKPARERLGWIVLSAVCAATLAVHLVSHLLRDQPLLVPGAAFVAAVLSFGLARLVANEQGQILLIIAGILLGLLALVSGV